MLESAELAIELVPDEETATVMLGAEETMLLADDATPEAALEMTLEALYELAVTESG